MSKTLDQIYIANPVTTILPTDLLYISQSPYTAGNDAAIAGSSLNALYATQTQTQRSAFNFAALAGSGNAFTVTLTPAVSALTDGMIVTFYSGSNSNTNESPTLSVNGLTPVTIVCWSGGLAPNDITTATEYLCIYNLADNVFQLVNPSISTANTFEVQANGYNYAPDTGVANAYIANILPAQISSINGGFEIIMQISNTNTTASTVTVNGTTKNIVNGDGSTLTANQMIAGSTALLVYNFNYGAFVLMNPSISSGLPNAGFSITGETDNGVLCSTFVGGLYLNSGYLPNVVQANYMANITALDPVTAIDFGQIQVTTSVVGLSSNVLNSFTANKLIVILGQFSIVSPVLTTLNLPEIVTLGNFLGTCNALTTLTLPKWYNTEGGFTFTANSLTTLNLTSLNTLQTTLSPVMNALTTFTTPALTKVYGAVGMSATSLTTWSLPSLIYLGAAFAPVMTSLTTLSMPALLTVVGSFSPTLASLTTLTLTSLQTLTGGFSPSFAALTTLALPAIVTISTLVAITAANMTTFSMGSTLKTVAGNWTMTGMKLNQASVDGILVSLAALDGTGGTTAYSSKTINLSGGTSSTPSATGLAAKATLVARSCTVTTN